MLNLDGDEKEIAGDSNEDTGAEENDSPDKSAELNLDEFFARDEVQDRIKRMVQSEADKRLASYQAKIAKEQRAREQASTRVEREKLLDEALEKGDADTAADIRRQEKLIKAVRTQVLAEVEDALKSHPTLVKELGEDTVNLLWKQTLDENGDLTDWLMRLAQERQTRDIKKLTEEARAELQKEYEAKLLEAGVEIRNQDEEEGRSPSEALTKGTPTSGGRKSLIDAAAAGEDVSFEALKAELKKQGINPLAY